MRKNIEPFRDQHQPGFSFEHTNIIYFNDIKKMIIIMHNTILVSDLLYNRERENHMHAITIMCADPICTEPPTLLGQENNC